MVSKKDRTNLFEIESKTLLDEELDDGILPENKLNLATLLIFVFLGVILAIANIFSDFTIAENVFYGFIALLLARQMALDFAYHVFLDIYTYPMVLMAIIIPPVFFSDGEVLTNFINGLGFMVFLGSITFICSLIMKKPAGFGGGDIKFAFLMGAFLNVLNMCFSIFLASVISLILTLAYKDKTNIPFGPGLITSFWICLLFGNIIMDKLTLILS